MTPDKDRVRVQLAAERAFDVYPPNVARTIAYALRCVLVDRAQPTGDDMLLVREIEDAPTVEGTAHSRMLAALNDALSAFANVLVNTGRLAGRLHATQPDTNTDDPTAWLAQLAALSGCVTPGPWRAVKETDGVHAGRWTAIRSDHDGRVVTVDQIRRHDHGRAEINVAWIAEAHRRMPELLDLAAQAVRDRRNTPPRAATAAEVTTQPATADTDAAASANTGHAPGGTQPPDRGQTWGTRPPPAETDTILTHPQAHAIHETLTVLAEMQATPGGHSAADLLRDIDWDGTPGRWVRLAPGSHVLSRQQARDVDAFLVRVADCGYVYREAEVARLRRQFGMHW